MDKRLELDQVFCELLGSENVYFQPPESVKMSYPAIVYSRDNIENQFADDSVYLQRVRYRVTVIDRDPDSVYVKKVSQLPKCRFDRHYSSDGLNHDSFILYD